MIWIFTAVSVLLFVIGYLIGLRQTARLIPRALARLSDDQLAHIADEVQKERLRLGRQT